MVPKVTSSSVQHGLTRIVELSRTSKITLVALGTLALGLAALAILKVFCSRRGEGGIAAQTGERVNVYADISGNPAHLGHMHMIGLAVRRLVEKGYQINQVKVALGPEDYLQSKVQLWNEEIQKNNNCPGNTTKMFIVPIPLEVRIEFLRAAIQQAKGVGVLEESLNIDYFDRRCGHGEDHLPFYQVCGVDFAETGGLAKVQRAVVVTRDEEPPQWLVDEARGDNNRLIVRNEAKTSGYSSSKIQNGDYHLLPESVRERFRKLHEAAQPKTMPVVLAALSDCPEEIKNPIARETAIATMNGFYITPSGNKKILRSGAKLLEGSRVFSNTILQHPVKPRYNACDIVVRNKDCLEAAEEELKNGKVAVLMLSSPSEPGGGMHAFENGQEEDLCRRSDIFGFMWDQSHFIATTLCYNLVDVVRAHQKNPQYSTMGNNRMIHVPQVTVFRSQKSDDYKMLEEPFEVGMLVSPGLDRPDYEKVDGKTRYKRNEDIEQLRKLMMTQLKVAYDENYDTVILGAFGCGAFWNPPEIIAEFYKKIIETYFKGAFRKIVFAILDDGPAGKHNPEGNFKPFQECFASNPDAAEK